MVTGGGDSSIRFWKVNDLSDFNEYVLIKYLMEKSTLKF